MHVMIFTIADSVLLSDTKASTLVCDTYEKRMLTTGLYYC